MRDYVFIGGSRDGQRIALEEPRRVLELPVYPPVAMRDALSKQEVELYILRVIYGGYEEIVVYSIQDLGIDAVLAKLVDNYRRQQ